MLPQLSHQSAVTAIVIFNYLEFLLELCLHSNRSFEKILDFKTNT